jgi:hypothetical protein
VGPRRRDRATVGGLRRRSRPGDRRDAGLTAYS